MVSSFLTPGKYVHESDVASLHLRRDQSVPIILSKVAVSAEEAGYAEGVVTNTRFGSFPHSTIIGAPWGSQIRASRVDTGSRGRKQVIGKKRKANDGDHDGDTPDVKEAVVASSGFVHVLPPTPESWTTSLPHRTQVVYTPDYSYILHRIRARPGSRLLEAGSGSGSFTHAAARAVFSGYPENANEENGHKAESITSEGKVFTFEFHEERHRKVRKEMQDHKLNSIVVASHRDVYKDGFLLLNDDKTEKTSPRANAIFLDLPAPWEALPHLTREESVSQPSALDPTIQAYICTFSPCIEQAQRTISALRRYGWLEIEMVEMQHKRIDIRREYTGYEYEGMRGVNPVAATVDEALSKLREVERRAREFHTGQSVAVPKPQAQARLQEDASKILFKDGKLIHRTEPEIRTHTSYLVFAILPRQWTDDDEARARQEISNAADLSSGIPKSRRQQKKENKQKNRAASRQEDR